jgi:1,4-alpha-glucan branching enzyme
MNKPALSLVLLLHHPFGGRPAPSRQEETSRGKRGGFYPGEVLLFETLTETCLPLLALFTRLERDGVPFQLALAVSPLLCTQLLNEETLDNYLNYLDRKIEFGRKELERTAQDPPVHALARRYYEADVEKRIFFTEVCDRDLPGFLRRLRKTGKLELLTTAASYAFLPFYETIPEALSAQFETALASHRRAFGKHPQGFWLPEFGWNETLDAPLRSYGFSYTLTEAHALALGNPPARKGSFYPAASPSGLVFLGRDFQAQADFAALMEEENSACYRARFTDAGFELSVKALRPFLGQAAARCPTGYCYRTGGVLYDPDRAADQAADHARRFLAALRGRLEEAGRYMEESPLSLCAFDAGVFGRSWHEGTVFLETLLREACLGGAPELVTPAGYLSSQDPSRFQTLVPEFSSWGDDGYGAFLLDASNDWIYRHVFRAARRMVELTERFPGDTGLKERALNQAARELLLAQGSDWPKMLFQGTLPDYAREQIEQALRNFTTIFEALGSSYISTEWLTELERRHCLFPFINFRVFSRKK